MVMDPSTVVSTATSSNETGKVVDRDDDGVEDRKFTTDDATCGTAEEAEIPFLETFWKLSSPDPVDRAAAASSLLRHCFPTSHSETSAVHPTPEHNTTHHLKKDERRKKHKRDKKSGHGKDRGGQGEGTKSGSTSAEALSHSPVSVRINPPHPSDISQSLLSSCNVRDAAYALRRLLDGLSSGRASARQGFASCLSAFLALACSPQKNANAVDRTGTVIAMDGIVKEFCRKNDADAGGAGGEVEADGEIWKKGDDDEEEGDHGDDGGEAYVESMEWLRAELLRRTDPSSSESGDGDEAKGAFAAGSKRSGRGGANAEERDHAFGRLFGMLAVSRSGVLDLGMQRLTASGLSPLVDDGDEDGKRKKALPLQTRYEEVLRGYVRDVVRLFKWRRWMREVACYAVIEFLDQLLRLRPEGNEDGRKLASYLDDDETEGAMVAARISAWNGIVKEVVVPDLLLFRPAVGGVDGEGDGNEEHHHQDDDEGGDHHNHPIDGSLLGVTPEQLAVGLHLQRTFRRFDHRYRNGLHWRKGRDSNGTPNPPHLILPPPLRQNAPLLSVDTLPLLAKGLIETAHMYPRRHLVWTHVLEALVPPPSDGTDNGEFGECGNSAAFSVERCKIIDRFFEEVIEGGMLNTTERKAMALTLMRDFASILPGEELALALRPKMARLLLNTAASASSSSVGKNSKRRQHTLHPLGRRVLASIVASALGDGDGEEGGDTIRRRHGPMRQLQAVRLATAKALLDVTPHFDVRTGTKSVSSLIQSLPSQKEEEAVGLDLRHLHLYLDYLEAKVVSMALRLSTQGESGGGADKGDDAADMEVDGLGQGPAEEEDDDEKDRGAKIMVHDAEGYVDLIYRTVKQSANSLNTHGREQVSRRVLGFLMACAFFGSFDKLSESAVPSASDQNEGMESMHPAVEAGLRVRRLLSRSDDVLGAGKRGHEISKFSLLPHPIRVACSAKFFSLLSDLCVSGGYPDCKSGVAAADDGQDATASECGNTSTTPVLPMSLKCLMHAAMGWASLEAHGAILTRPALDGEALHSRQLSGEACELSLSLLSRKEGSTSDATAKGSEKPDNERKLLSVRSQFAVGCTVLVLVLYLQLLRCGVDDYFNSAIPGSSLVEEDDYDVDDDMNEAIQDLCGAMKQLLAHACNLDNMASNAVVDRIKGCDQISESSDVFEHPLAVLADVCISVLSINEAGKSRGASTKLLRESVKCAWLASLSVYSHMASLRGELDDRTHGESMTKANADVIKALVHAVCGANAADDSNEDMDEASAETELEEGSDSDAEQIFSSREAAEISFDDGDNSISGEDSDVGDDESGSDGVASEQHGPAPRSETKDEDDVELDPRQLESLLIGDSEDEDQGITELEHHAGADAALANLIKLKQEGRKAAIQEQERTATWQRLRCTSLLEACFSNRNCSIFCTKSVISALVPLLKSRRALEKAITSASSEDRFSGKIGLSEKRALLERVTSILKAKVCKAKVSLLNDQEIENGFIITTAEAIMSEAKKSPNSVHCGCCSTALLFVLKCTPGHVAKREVARVYIGAIEDWSTRRTTKLHTTLFEEFVKRFPEIAVPTLCVPVSIAATNARSPYVKSESFRLLSSMFAIKDEKTTSSLEKALIPSSNALLSAFEEGEALLKGKRLRDILKANEVILSFAKANGKKESAFWETMERLSPLLQSVGAESQSDGVKRTCSKIVSSISSREFIENDGVKVQSNAKRSVEKSKSKKGSSRKKARKHKSKRSKK